MTMFAKKPIEAERVGNTLVASFRNSRPPLVWRFDLERNHSFSLALEGDDGDCELGVTSPKGEFYPIARFVARTDGEDAMAAVQKILLKKKGNWVSKILLTLLVLIVLLVLGMGAAYFFRGALSPTSSTSSMMPMALPGLPALPRYNEVPSGVPLPADRVLRPPP
jgi:hypothetical protein